jgi:hypothetical protein
MAWRKNLHTALANVERYDAALTAAVAAARAAGASWAAIGDELGTSAQAAHARFARKVRGEPTTQTGD